MMDKIPTQTIWVMIELTSQIRLTGNRYVKRIFGIYSNAGEAMMTRRK